MSDIDNIHMQGKLRLRILGLHHAAGSGHIGCSLSCIDLMAAIMPRKRENDTFILSKGHAATALYSVMNEMGWIPDADMPTFYKDGTTLPAHPAPGKYDCIPFATGSLGHGLPIGTGIALANKLKNNTGTSYVLMSDGETNEGTTWEAMHFAVANKLDNLLVMIDKNGLQGFGSTKDILGDTASAIIWQQVGFEVATVDGHDITAIRSAVDMLLANKNGRPKLLIASTVKGKGIPHMEGKMEWHYLPMDSEMYEKATLHIRETYDLNAE